MVLGSDGRGEPTAGLRGDPSTVVSLFPSHPRPCPSPAPALRMAPAFLLLLAVVAELSFRRAGATMMMGGDEFETDRFEPLPGPLLGYDVVLVAGQSNSAGTSSLFLLSLAAAPRPWPAVGAPTPRKALLDKSCHPVSLSFFLSAHGRKGAGETPDPAAQAEFATTGQHIYYSRAVRMRMNE